jgi:hypothetical protein
VVTEPASTPDFWTEAHNSPGATHTATRWALAEGESADRSPPRHTSHRDTSHFAGQARVRLYFEDGTSTERTVGLGPHSRTNHQCLARSARSGAPSLRQLVESLGSTPAQVVVERALYTSPVGITWAAGTNALATARDGTPPRPPSSPPGRR